MIDREGIYEEFNAERKRQLDKWGPQSWPMVREELVRAQTINGRMSMIREQRIATRHLIQSEAAYKRKCDKRSDEGMLSWSDILLEELVEAIYALDPAHIREELVQLGAVVVAAIEDLDKKKASE